MISDVEPFRRAAWLWSINTARSAIFPHLSSCWT